MDETEDGYVNELKLALNNAIWMLAPPNITLAQAEEASIAALTVICGYDNERLTNAKENK